MVRICWDIKILLNWKIEKLHEGWMILLLFVTLCALKFPSNLSQAPNPKHWHLCCWHILLDVKIDLVPNLHSVAKSAGSWVQEKIERDTAALNLHSSTDGMPLVHWSNIITSVHRPPQKPKRFRVEMVMGKYSMFWPSTNNDKKVLKWS